MARNLKELAAEDQNAMLDAVRGSAHQIWQAGLGAFAKAQQEGGDLFDKLVREGAELQKLAERLTGERGFSVSDTMAKLAGTASRQASGSWDKLEKVFEERVARALRGLGVPSQEEVNALSRDMAELKAALAGAEKTPAPGKPAGARPSAKAAAKATGRSPAKAPAQAALKKAVKPAAKPTAVKSSAAKKQARSASGAT